MTLTKEQITEIRQAFSSTIKPVIIFDDDPDGLSSFLMTYKFIKEGRGIPVKNSPEVGVEFAKKVNDYAPDLVIILDKPIVSQEFIDKVNAKIIWIDHHPPLERKGIKYYNPLLNDPKDNRPTSYWVYKAVQQNLWIGMTGMIGDWFLPEKKLVDEFIEKYPELLSPEINKPEVAIHESEIGKLIRVFAFNLKGKVSDVIKSIKTLTRIKEPEEILKQTTPRGRFVFKKYEKLAKIYDKLIKNVKVDPNEELVVVKYEKQEYSFSAILSNELIYRYPDKFILIAWEYEGEYKCSMRSVKRIIPPILKKALIGVNGYGGGHDHACGGCIKVDSFDLFVENLKKEL